MRFDDWRVLNEAGGFKNMPADQFKRYLASLNSDEARKKAQSAWTKARKRSQPQLPNFTNTKEITRADLNNPPTMRNVRNNPGAYKPGRGVTPNFTRTPNWTPPTPPSVKGGKGSKSLIKGIWNIAKKNKKLALFGAGLAGVHHLMNRGKKNEEYVPEMMGAGGMMGGGPTNSLGGGPGERPYGSGAIAGTKQAGDDPIINKRKRKPTIIARGRMGGARTRFKNGVELINKIRHA